MGTEAALLAMAGVQAIGTAGDIFAARGRYAYEREILRMNERMALMAAEDAIRRGDLEAATIRRRARTTLGLQQATLGLTGVDPFTGTAAALQEETMALSEYDRQIIRVSAFREAYGYRSRALQFGLQRRMAKIASRQAQAQAVSEGMSNIAQTGIAYGSGKLPEISFPNVLEPSSAERSLAQIAPGVDHLLRAVPRY